MWLPIPSGCGIFTPLSARVSFQLPMRRRCHSIAGISIPTSGLLCDGCIRTHHSTMTNRAILRAGSERIFGFSLKGMMKRQTAFEGYLMRKTLRISFRSVKESSGRSYNAAFKDVSGQIFLGENLASYVYIHTCTYSVSATCSAAVLLHL